MQLVATSPGPCCSGKLIIPWQSLSVFLIQLDVDCHSYANPRDRLWDQSSSIAESTHVASCEGNLIHSSSSEVSEKSHKLGQPVKDYEHSIISCIFGICWCFWEWDPRHSRGNEGKDCTGWQNMWRVEDPLFRSRDDSIPGRGAVRVLVERASWPLTPLLSKKDTSWRNFNCNRKSWTPAKPEVAFYLQPLPAMWKVFSNLAHQQFHHASWEGCMLSRQWKDVQSNIFLLESNSAVLWMLIWM